MQRLVSNPPNPWSTRYVEWIDAPPQVEITVYEEEARSALATNDSPDIPFRWSVNPYRGCQHACAYCYARPGHQWLGFGAGTDFDSRIVVKKNVARLLERELAKKSWRRELVAFSGVTDCYQPLEASYGLTRACLEACLRASTPVGVITKSALVRRDADVLAALARGPGASVHLSITFTDESMSRAIEPWASAPRTRFETLRILAEAGISTGVLIAPVIPGLNDSQIPEILERSRDAGARQAGMVLLRLPLEVRPVFEERLRSAYPDRAQKVLHALAELGGGKISRPDFGARMHGEGPRWEVLASLFQVTCRRLGLSYGERDEEGPEIGPRARTGQGELFA